MSLYMVLRPTRGHPQLMDDTMVELTEEERARRRQMAKRRRDTSREVRMCADDNTFLVDWMDVNTTNASRFAVRRKRPPTAIESATFRRFVDRTLTPFVVETKDKKFAKALGELNEVILSKSTTGEEWQDAILDFNDDIAEVMCAKICACILDVVTR